MEEKGRFWYEQVEAMGGARVAIESGYYLKKMAEGQYQYQKEVESGERQVIGVNKFSLDAKTSISIFKGNPNDERKQVNRLKRVRRERDKARVDRKLGELRKVAEAKATGKVVNIMPAMLDAVRANATEGEIFSALRAVFGDYKPPVIF
jgi:methylmalonyl-CoA mutase N-terminal domain/subunit